MGMTSIPAGSNSGGLASAGPSGIPAPGAKVSGPTDVPNFGRINPKSSKSTFISHLSFRRRITILYTASVSR